MGSRENVDLFTKHGRYVFFRAGLIGDRYTRHYAKIDTFGHHICAIIGHGELWESPEEPITVCLRCGKRVIV